MKRIVSLLLSGALVCTLFSGCGQKSEEPYVPTGDALVMEDEIVEEELYDDEELQQLTLAYYPEWSMNPIIGTNITNRVLFSLIYQPLFAVDRKNNTWPILCSGYRVASDRRTYTFFVDPNARFSDGSRVTADDVIATYEAARNSSYYKGRFTYVDRFQLSDDGGITFYLTTAYENFPILLDIPIVKSSQVSSDYPVGSGPYVFEKGEESAHLLRVGEWWCEAILPTAAQVIDLVEAESQAQIRDEFEFGDLGLACANPMADSFAEYRCDYELWDCENGLFMYLGVNVLDSPYFKNSDVLRKALTYAIDRETLNEENYHGLAQPATLPTSPGSPYYNKSLAARFEYDPMRFVSEISNFQLPKNDKGEVEKLLILVNADDSARLRTARDIAAHLTELGIPAGTLEYGTQGPGTTFEQVLKARTYDLYLGQTKLPATMDLSEFFRNWGNISYGGILDETLLNMSKEALANSGIYYNLNQMVAENAKIIPVLFGNYTIYANRGSLLDLQPSRDNVFFYKIEEKTMASVLITPENNG